MRREREPLEDRNLRWSILCAIFIVCVLLGVVCAPLGAKADGLAKGHGFGLTRLRLADTSSSAELLPPGLEPPSDLKPSTPLEWYLFYSAVAYRKQMKMERARADRLQEDLMECNTIRSVIENEPPPAPPAPPDRRFTAGGFDWTAFGIGAGIGGAAALSVTLALILALPGGG